MMRCLRAVGPVRDAAVREPQVRRPADLPGFGIVLPEGAPGAGIDRREHAERCQGVEDAVGHQRRVLDTPPGRACGLAFTSALSGEFHRHATLKVADIGAGDLVERRVFRAAGVAAVVAPLARRRRGRSLARDVNRGDKRGRAGRSGHPDKNRKPVRISFFVLDFSFSFSLLLLPDTDVIYIPSYSQQIHPPPFLTTSPHT